MILTVNRIGQIRIQSIVNVVAHPCHPIDIILTFQIQTAF